MGSKAKYTVSQKVQVCTDYLSRKKSAVQIARELNMSKSGRRTIRAWSEEFRAYGISAFEQMHTNQSYSREFKEKIVKEYLDGRESYESLLIKYRIPSYTTITQWVSRYNNHIELKDYDPKSEVYTAERRKTTFEERIKIVRYCLDHDRNVKNTASLYRCSYAQVYSWVWKYEKDGSQGLIDNRGIRKKKEELTNLEKSTGADRKA